MHQFYRFQSRQKGLFGQITTSTFTAEYWTLYMPSCTEQSTF